MNSGNDFSTVVFDPKFNLTGGMLIEAGAGTGKTYNIQNVYLRLVIAEGVPAQNILVVTFTEAATHELRERLRQILASCRAYLEWRQQTSNTEAEYPLADPAEKERLAKACALPLRGTNKQADSVRLARVRLALMDFDNAAIFTIHGFCKRVLDRYAFECGHDPDAELMPDPGMLIRDVCRDWWREHTYKTPDFRADLPFANLSEFEELVRAAFNHPDAALEPDAGENDSWELPSAGLLNAIRELESQTRELQPYADAKRLANLLTAIKDELEKPTRDLSALRDLLKSADGMMPKAAWKMSAGGGKAKKSKCYIDDLTPELPRATEKLRRRIAALMIPAVAAAVGQVRVLARERNALTYDAMLLNVRDALKNEYAGARLRQVLRDEFKAAMIDEFQDTDSVQYEVFRLIFAEPGQAQPHPPLVFVGDPRQAIFGFRGGDVFTYYAAKAGIDEINRHTLNKNFRAEKNLVAAINEFFRDPPAPAPRTFLNDNITCDGRLESGDIAIDRQLTQDNQRLDKPFHIRVYPLQGNRPPGRDSRVAMRMYDDVARETVRLLTDKNLKIGNRNITAADIAVLVLDRYEADFIHTKLLERGVNAVRQATDCVFDADEAAGLAYIMNAMRQPRHGKTVRSALCQPFIPCSMSDIRRFNDETATDIAGTETYPADMDDDNIIIPREFTGWMELFAEAGQCWETHSFIEGFRRLEERLGLRACIIGMPDGDRRLANLLHLVELAHKTACAQQLAPTALWRWLVRQLDQATRDSADSDDFKTRPASDACAVKIMTVFKSKGLQFPIVFAPTLWRRQPTGKGKISRHQYHDHSQHMILNFDAQDKTAQQRAQQESLEEDIRLVYVALTRAVNRTYVWALDNSETRADSCAFDHVLTQWRRRTEHDIESRHIEEIAADNVTWDGVPEKCRPPAASRIHEPVTVQVDKSHGHASFSALATRHDISPAKTITDEFRDVDAVSAEPDSDAGPVPAAPDTDTRIDIFSIPGGARTGDCWHGIFEKLDFQADDRHTRTVIDAELDRFNICRGSTDEIITAKRQAVHAMVHRTLNTRLDTGYGELKLREIPATGRRAEMTFLFSLKQQGEQQTLGAIGRVLEKHWRTPARDDDFIAYLKQSEKQLPLGFMVGSIDLTFQHNERFYIADWKSNRLGGQLENFTPPGLKAEMAAHSYYLQYMIYCVAAHGFLRQTLTDYDYDRHFGGAFYVFLRGVDDTPGQGIFTDRPSAELIQNLSAILAGGV